MKKLILFLIAILGAGAVYYGWQKKVTAPTQDINTASSTPIITEQPIKDLTGKELAWQTFQNYLAYNRTHDLAKLKSAVYKISDVCSSTGSTTLCNARMDSAYEYGTKINKFDLTNFVEDDKQAILSSEPKLVDTSDQIGYAREIIYFVKAGGQLKLLRFYPSKGVFLPKEGGPTLDELKVSTRNAVADADNDGLEDSQDKNSNDKDLDKDGWWDGIEVQMEVK